MNPFDELDEFLGEEISLGYWSEVGLDSAAGMLAEFDSGNWESLKSCWSSRSPEWVMRCTQVLEYGDTEQSVPLLLEILLHENDEVAQQAADTLDTHRLRSLPITANSAVRARLQDLVKQRPSLDAKTDQSLLERFHFSPS